MQNIKIRKANLLIIIAICIIFCFINGFFQTANAADSSVALTVKGDGVEREVQFTMADLKALPQKTYTYSGYNHWPSLQVFKDIKGPSLKDILDKAGLKNSAVWIRVNSGGGAYSDFTKEQLLYEQRYYFPDGEAVGDVVDWPPKRSEAGKKPVETIIDLYCPGGKLLYGQKAPNEPTCCKNQMLEGICSGGCIEVFTSPLERWEAPNADIAPGYVEENTKVTLKHKDGTPYHAIVYYTLDGSEPTYGSNVANISYPNFQPEMNKPILINGEVTIKTRTIGMGKLDSETVTYKYTTKKSDGNKNTETGASFTDIDSHWAKDNIEFLYKKDIVTGITDTEFAPDMKITRAQFAEYLVRALGIEVKKGQTGSFKDVSADAEYSDYVETACKEGLITGINSSNFAPDENISREQMAVIISRLLNKKGIDLISEDTCLEIINGFKDKNSFSSWAQQGIAVTTNSKIMKGQSKDTFAPKASTTRAEAAVIIERLYKKINNMA